MRRRTKVILGIGCLLPVLAVASVVLMLWIGPPGPHFTCHRGLDAWFEQWKLAATNGDWYPNVEGNSTKSLALIAPWIREGAHELRDYRYVPGLKSSDPADLILMYVKEPTRRKWHGDTRWFRLEKRWVVLNPRMEMGEEDRWGEVCEWIPADEFTNRLGRTLRFLESNRREHWAAVASEHMGQLQTSNAPNVGERAPAPANSSGTAPEPQRPVPSATNAVLTPVGHLKTKDKLVTIQTGPAGPLYTVRANDGTVLAADLPAAALSAQFPELKDVVERGVADWAGSDWTLKVGE